MIRWNTDDADDTDDHRFFKEQVKQIFADRLRRNKITTEHRPIELNFLRILDEAYLW